MVSRTAEYVTFQVLIASSQLSLRFHCLQPPLEHQSASHREPLCSWEGILTPMEIDLSNILCLIVGARVAPLNETAAF